METGAPDPPVPRRRFGLRVLRIGLLLLGLGVLAVGLGLGWLLSPWGRAFLARKISQRCGLEAQIDSLGWSPGGGLELRGMRLLQPEVLRGQMAEPLLKIDAVRFSPEWRMLLNKRVVARDIHLERPKLTVTVEMLSQLAQRAPKPEMGPLAQQSQGQPSPNGQPATTGTSEQPSPTGSSTQTGQNPTAQVAPPVSQKTIIPTSWLRIRDGGFLLVSASSGRVVSDVSEFSCDLPCGGQSAVGKLSMGHLEFLGERILTGFAARLEWTEPALALTPEPADQCIRGVNVRLAARFGLVPGLPMEARVEAPPQRFAVSNIAGLACDAADTKATAYFMGLLVAPGTWQAELLAASSSVTLRHPEKEWVFDESRCAVVCRSGVVSCVDARLVSDSLSLLGNGTLVADGRLAAVLRVVGGEEAATAVARRLLRDPALSPKAISLAPAARVALDLKLSGTFNEPLLQVGEDAVPTPLRSTSPPPP